MRKTSALMLIGGVVDPGAGQPGAIVAYVAVSGGRDGSRLFRVEGCASAPVVRELPPETTLDLGRFDYEVQRELGPAIRAIEEAGGKAGTAKPNPAWVCKQVGDHLKAKEGIEIEVLLPAAT